MTRASGRRSGKLLQRAGQHPLLQLDRQHSPAEPADLVVRAVHGGRNVGGQFSRRRFGRREHFRQGLRLQSQPGQLLTDVVVQVLRDAPLDLLGSCQQVFLELGTLDDPAQLHADADHRVGNPLHRVG